jgi:hypothetical protein
MIVKHLPQKPDTQPFIYRTESVDTKIDGGTFSDNTAKHYISSEKYL